MLYDLPQISLFKYHFKEKKSFFVDNFIQESSVSVEKKPLNICKGWKFCEAMLFIYLVEDFYNNSSFISNIHIVLRRSQTKFQKKTK